MLKATYTKALDILILLISCLGYRDISSVSFRASPPWHPQPKFLFNLRKHNKSNANPPIIL